MAELLQSMLDGPAGTPPVGELPHLKNSQNLNAVFISSLALALTFGTLAVVMRMYTKMLIIQSLSHEDCEFSSRLDVTTLLIFYQMQSRWDG